jgi:hypothetical protein
MRILLLSVIFATLLAVRFVPTVQQAPCHCLAGGAFNNWDNGLNDETGSRTGIAGAAEVQIFCAGAGAS